MTSDHAAVVYVFLGVLHLLVWRAFRRPLAGYFWELRETLRDSVWSILSSGRSCKRVSSYIEALVCSLAKPSSLLSLLVGT